MAVVIPIVIIAGILAWVFRPKTGTTKARWIAILATVVPLVIVAIAALVFQLLQNATGNPVLSDISNICSIIGLGLIGAAILTLLAFAVAHKIEIVKGIGFGLTIMIILAALDIFFLEALAGV